MNPAPNHEKQSPRIAGIARGSALFFGLYAFIGLIVSLCSRGLDLNLWWIDLRALPVAFAAFLMAAFAFVMLAFALRPPRNRILRVFSAIVGFAVAAFAGANAISFWILCFSERIQPGSWIPISSVIALLVAWITRTLWTQGNARCLSPYAAGGAFVICCCLFPVAQVVGFGKTNYSRPADMAVVFGARVYSDGRLSDALEDRVSTAVLLFRRGLVQQLVMSGGPGDGAVHEADAMRRRAVELGVPVSAITVDYNGFNTAATVQNTAKGDASQVRRIIAVSEFYHLPRIKLAYASAGVNVATVPARARHWARNWPAKNILREVPAFWVYFARAAANAIWVAHA
jgi:vancomycin permeability regulator SanA